MKRKKRAYSDVEGLRPVEPYESEDAPEEVREARRPLPDSPYIEVGPVKAGPEELDHLRQRGSSMARPMGAAFEKRVRDLERKLDSGKELSAEDVRYLAQRTALGLLDCPRNSVRIQAAKLLADTVAKKPAQRAPKVLDQAREILG